MATSRGQLIELPAMEAKVYVLILAAFAVLALGGCVIRLVNLNLPKPRDVRELVMFTFWIYPPSWDWKKIRANKIAWLLVVFVTYMTVTVWFF
jgi:hypothetical protein